MVFAKALPRHKNLRKTVFYLFGPGRNNEHVDPHLVAAWDPDVLDNYARPDQRGQAELVDLLDAPRVLVGVEVKAGHVYHVPISLHARDGTLGDRVWRRIVTDAVARLGLTGPAGTNTCRWILVHHGPNTTGNDHVHLVVQLVGEHGKLRDLKFDKRTWSRWRADVEIELTRLRHGGENTGPVPLTPTAEDGRGAQHLSRAEHERARRTGREPDRIRLERIVRAAAAAAENEVQFVELLRADGVDVRPRTTGSSFDTVVTGYSAALPQRPGEPRLWFTGGSLARDLTLPKLRDRWAWTKQNSVLYAVWEGRYRAGQTGATSVTSTPDKWLRKRVQSTCEQAGTVFSNSNQRDRALEEIAELAVVLTWRTGNYRDGADALAAAARLTRSHHIPQLNRTFQPNIPVVLNAVRDLTRALARVPDPAPLLALVLLVLAVFTAAAALAYLGKQRRDRLLDRHLQIAKASYPAAPIAATTPHQDVPGKVTSPGRRATKRPIVHRPIALPPGTTGRAR